MRYITINGCIFNYQMIAVINDEYEWRLICGEISSFNIDRIPKLFIRSASGGSFVILKMGAKHEAK
jgi:hypothetical protein